MAEHILKEADSTMSSTNNTDLNDVLPAPPKVTIIIPVFNVAAYLPKCLESILQQTLKEIEVICINDASTDDSLAVLEQYKLKDRRLQVVSVEKSGQGVIRDMGVRMARSEYIGFVDGDDYVDLSMFEKLYSAAKSDDSDIAFCHAKCSDAKGKDITVPYFETEREKCGLNGPPLTLAQEQVHELLSYLTVVAWNKIYKRIFLLQHDIIFGHGIIHEDIPFYYEAMLRANRVTVVRECLYRYMVNRPGSTTHMVMSTYPGIIQNLYKTHSRIKPWMQDKVVATQFYRFYVMQLLSFILYAFHRHDLKNFTRYRFFIMVHREFKLMDKQFLSQLSKGDYRDYRIIKNRCLRLFKLRMLLQLTIYYIKAPGDFFRMIYGIIWMFCVRRYYNTKYRIYQMRMFGIKCLQHTRYLLYHIKTITKNLYYKLIYKFK